VKPCPKPPPREKKPKKGLQRKSYIQRSTKRMAPRREGDDPEFWERQCDTVNEVQAGCCAVCDKFFGRVDTMHIRGIGRTVYRGRHNPHNELNHLPNLLGGCRPCHVAFDAQPLATRIIVGAELKKKFSWPPQDEIS
jgi:hypothetical protein